MRRPLSTLAPLPANEWRRAAALSVFVTLASLVFPAIAAAQAVNIDLGTGAGLTERVVQLVGLMTVHRTRFLHRLPDARITSLVVAASERGRGIGRQLVAAAEAMALEWGCARVEVTSGFPHRDAHGFYEHLGYTHNARRFVRTIAS